MYMLVSLLISFAVLHFFMNYCVPIHVSSCIFPKENLCLVVFLLLESRVLNNAYNTKLFLVLLGLAEMSLLHDFY